MAVTLMAYDEAIETLAQWHVEAHTTGPIAIYSYDDPAQEKVRLIEVAEDFGPTGIVFALEFRPSFELPYATQIALLNPQEWEQLQAGKMTLPEGWENTTPRQIWPRPEATDEQS